MCVCAVTASALFVHGEAAPANGENSDKQSSQHVRDKRGRSMCWPHMLRWILMRHQCPKTNEVHGFRVEGLVHGSWQKPLTMARRHISLSESGSIVTPREYSTTTQTKPCLPVSLGFRNSDLFASDDGGGLTSDPVAKRGCGLSH